MRGWQGMEMREKKKFKIVFLMPPQEKNGDFRDLRDFILDNQGVKSIITTLNEGGYEADFINADLLDLTMEQVIQILQNMEQPDLLGISMVENNVEMVLKLLDAFQSLNYHTKIVLGGFFPTLCYEELMESSPMIDYCMIGEGEKSTLDLVNCLVDNTPLANVPGLVYRDEENHLVVNPQKELDVYHLKLNYDMNLPYLIERGGSEYIFTSRGCNGNCKFCSIKAFYQYIPRKPWREICIQHVVDKIEYLNTHWKQRIIPLWDDNFLSGKRGKERAYELIEEVKKRKINAKFFINCRVDDVDEELFRGLKEIGLYQVGLGIENIRDDVLKFYGKGTNSQRIRKALDILDRLGLETYMSLIIFNPFTTLETVEDNLKFFWERFDKESASTYKNHLQPTVTVLGLTRGARILNDPSVKEISYKTGFHYNYDMQDKKAGLLKMLMLNLALEWWHIYIILIQLDNYVFNPFYDYYKKMEDADAIREYDEIWRNLAFCHLSTYQKIIDKFKADDYQLDEILESFSLELNQLIEKTNNLINRYKLDQVFPKIQYYTFEKENRLMLFDITKSEFHEILPVHKDILERYNYMKEGDIKRELQECYSLSELNEGFQFLDKLISDGSLVCKKDVLKTNNTKLFLRRCKMILKSQKLLDM